MEQPGLTESATLPDLDVTVVLRPGRLSDLYRAMSLVPVPDETIQDDDHRLTPCGVAYQSAVDDMQVLCQIASMGGQPVPDLVELADDLSPDDMAELRQAAGQLKKKKRLSKSNSTPGELQSAA